MDDQLDLTSTDDDDDLDGAFSARENVHKSKRESKLHDHFEF